MEVFKSVTTLCGWGLASLAGEQPFLGGEFCLGGVAPSSVWAGLPKKGFSLPIEERPHPQRVVTDFKNHHENVTFYFHSASMFVKYLGIKSI